MYRVLQNINTPTDVKKLNNDQLNILAQEIRDAILNQDSIIGGHVGPNLGIVETTIALHYVFASARVQKSSGFEQTNFVCENMITR